MSWQTPDGDRPPDDAVPTPDAASPEAPAPTEAPGAPAPTDAPTVTWAAPTSNPAATGWGSAEPSARVSITEGLVISRVFARLVAYSVDVFLLTCAEVIVSGLLGQYGDNPGPSVALIVNVVFLGFDFVYFVGSWTSGWQATLGMRLLRLRVLGARDAGTLSLPGAVIRWLALSGAIGILSVLPRIGGYGQLLGVVWVLALLVTTGTDRLHQGMHDRWAGSVVVQPALSGSGAAVFTCLALVVFVGLVLPLLALALVGDQLREIISQIGNSI